MLERLVLIAFLLVCGSALCAEPLASWNEGDSRDAIVDFVDAVTSEGGEKYVPPAERIVVFDNDGTLWSEQPAYFQLLFALDRVRDMAPQNPGWRTREPFASVLKGDRETVLAGGKRAVMELIMATHANQTTEEFADDVREWIATARHPTTGRPYTEMVYQPMLELLDYLRANGFKTFIVSGGGIEFLRVFAEEVYGVPPEQVVGSSIKTEFQMRDGEPILVRLPMIDFIDDAEGKPVGINQYIGRRPLAAFGNSDGDLPMLQWTAAGPGPRLCLIVHHTDGKREWAYDRESQLGRLDKALSEAEVRDWIVVDMEREWKKIHPRN